jgi:hypothetical protein
MAIQSKQPIFPVFFTQKEMRLLPSWLDKGFAESVLGNG